MRRTLCCASFCLINAIVCATSYSQADTQSTTFLQTALKTFGAGAITDVTLTGTAQRIAGSVNETIPTTLEALSSGSVQLSYQTSLGALTEVRTVTTTGIWSGNWVDPQGKTHVLAYHNMMTDPDWFFPVLTVMRALDATSGQAISYVGVETFQGTAVQHLRIISAPSASAQIQALAQSELYLNATTLLPAALTFNDHPDDNALVNIPVTVLFFNYQTLGGLFLPTEVQQYRNNSLSLDLHIQGIALNTGITITLPAAQ